MANDDDYDKIVELTKENEKLANRAIDDYDKIVELEKHVKNLKIELDASRGRLKESEQVSININTHLDNANEALSQEREKLEHLEDKITLLNEEIAHEMAASNNIQEQLTALYADVEQAHIARQAALEARDDARVQQRDHELRFEELNEQWQETKARVTELEEMLEAMEDMDETHAELSNDIARLREEVADHERTIIVKDERINHLETQYQKERQRNIAGHQEQARAAAASPIDDGPQHVSNIDESLEDELRNENFDEGDEEDDVWDFSDINETFAYSPIAPAQEPPRTFHPRAAAVSTAPIAPAPAKPSLSDVRKVASTEPIAPTPAPPSTISVRDAASTIPVPLTVPKHSIDVREAVSTIPEAAKVPKHTSHVQEAASTAPRPAAVPKLNIDTREAASTAPRAPVVPKQTIDVHNAASTSPRAPTVPKQTIDVQNAASTAPIEPTLALSSLSNVHEIASFSPVEPALAPSTITEHEIANYAPGQPEVPALTVNVKEAASVAPTDRQITTADLFTQTEAPDAPKLTTQLLQHPTFDRSPVERTEIVTADQSIQTDIQQLGIRIFEDAIIDVAPIEPEIVEPEPTSEVGVQTTTEFTTATGTQTIPASPNNRLAPVMVTHEVVPVNQTVPEAVSTPPNTTHTTETVEIVPAAPNTTSKPSHLSDWLPMIIIVALFAWCLSLYGELATWKYANGIGIGYGHGNMGSRSGAYGNGRHLFGIVPIGMDIGNSWLSEQITRHMAMAITRFEDWAGLVNEPLY
jgi:hypothetical protein